MEKIIRLGSVLDPELRPQLESFFYLWQSGDHSAFADHVWSAQFRDMMKLVNDRYCPNAILECLELSPICVHCSKFKVCMPFPGCWFKVTYRYV